MDHARSYELRRLLALGHPGKLTKLWMGQWDTHSARSPAAVGPLAELARDLLGSDVPDSPTVEGLFMGFPLDTRSRLAAELRARIRARVGDWLGEGADVAVALVSMAGDWLLEASYMSPWR